MFRAAPRVISGHLKQPTLLVHSPQRSVWFCCEPSGRWRGPCQGASRDTGSTWTLLLEPGLLLLSHNRAPKQLNSACPCSPGWARSWLTTLLFSFRILFLPQGNDSCPRWVTPAQYQHIAGGTGNSPPSWQHLEKRVRKRARKNNDNTGLITGYE